MRPGRVRRFPLPQRIFGRVRGPQAANDNIPSIRESATSLVVGRLLIVAAALAGLGLVIGWVVWLGRMIWRNFI